MNDHAHKKKKSSSKTKKKKQEVEEEIPDTESSDEELDLTKECHPIAHYINDRAEMISQMFSVIKGNKLKAMLPPILKDFDVEKLKLQCLDQLLGMSERRITCILEGEILDSSSESEVPSDVESEDSQTGKSSQTSEKGSTRTSSTRKRNKRKSEAERDGKASKISKVEEDLPAPEQGKTLLEILELEMRARAIRALLKQGVDSEPRPAASREPNQSKNNGDIVDLTADEDFPTVVKIEPPTEQEKSFEDKVVKSSTATKPTETSKQVDAKKQRLIAEQDLRNKLIKKKTYRTRQQRIENLDEDVQNEVVEVSTEVPGNPVEELPEVLVKVEPAEIVIEDPEEGEVSSDEETSPPPVVVKVEKSKSPEPQTEGEKPMDGERITAMDDGEFVANENVEWTNEAVEMISPADVTHTVIDLENEPEILGNEGNQELEPEGSAVDLREDSEVSQQGNESNQSGTKPLTDLPIGEEEETTWRGRWLKKDEVQKVVKSSKICGLVKKRLKSKKAVAATLAEIPAMEPERQETETPPPLALLEGSVREYEELLRKKTEEKSGEGAESPVPSKGEVVPESPGQVVSEQTGGLQSEAESLAEPSTNVAEEMVETAVVESCSGDGVTSNPSDETQNQDKNQEKFTEEPSETKLETEQSEQTNR